jgi:hypothetical protein
VAEAKQRNADNSCAQKLTKQTLVEMGADQSDKKIGSKDLKNMSPPSYFEATYPPFYENPLTSVDSDDQKADAYLVNELKLKNLGNFS